MGKYESGIENAVVSPDQRDCCQYNLQKGKNLPHDLHKERGFRFFVDSGGAVHCERMMREVREQVTPTTIYHAMKIAPDENTWYTINAATTLVFGGVDAETGEIIIREKKSPSE